MWQTNIDDPNDEDEAINLYGYIISNPREICSIIFGATEMIILAVAFFSLFLIDFIAHIIVAFTDNL